MLTDDFPDRSLGLGMRLFQMHEHRRFLDTAVYPQAECDEDEAEQEWDAPRPCEESVVNRQRCNRGDQTRTKHNRQHSAFFA